MLWNGDCFQGFEMIGDNEVDISFTSPPYNRKRNDKYSFYNDQIDDYYSFLCNFTDELLRVSKRHVFVNIQKNYYNKEDVFQYIGKYSKQIKEVIIWCKSNPMPASGHNITNSYEYIIVLGSEPLKSNTTYTKNVITTSVNNETFKTHKAVMNRQLSDYIIENFTKPTDKILDPFFGLGTTGISCMKYGRKWIGFEINREYCDSCVDRFNNEQINNSDIKYFFY